MKERTATERFDVTVPATHDPDADAELAIGMAQGKIPIDDVYGEWEAVLQHRRAGKAHYRVTHTYCVPA